ncbi:hypothetical protein Z517_09584 [Fonsecaea pedrosoi CBS 271.37]|uniref:Uncharacterized protein n=1 Tax=Fonsecaea pedrosoi CBS 271.37 TaxID=1442368 RepID=A0A0D2G8W1_9EURO|nr:uncharacterized protein Z517_09584 [Fonsecaea pedrosoi CBS 271.37]KIW77138.1 hypothetical protein Z517_09584 [Fonsecaea pedrosoi CBS 271.37]
MCWEALLTIRHWSWDLRYGTRSAPDRGFIPNDSLLDTNEIGALAKDDETTFDLQVDPDLPRDPTPEAIAQMATRSIFGWLRSDGHPMEEKDIWRHSWLNVNYSLDEDDDNLSEEVRDDGAPSPTTREWLYK